MAQGPQYRVRDRYGRKWMQEEGVLFHKVNIWTDGRGYFDSCAPFTSYTKESNRELRERAEMAEARAKELEADIVAARRHYHDRVVEETHTLQSQVNTLCDEIDALRARVAELDADRVRLDASLVSAFQDGQGSIWPKLEAAEARIRELEAQLGAKPEGKEWKP